MPEPNTLCDLCAQLDVFCGVQDLKLHEGETRLTSTGLPSRWYKNLSIVQRSAATCYLCSLVLKGWREHRKVRIKDEGDAGNYSIRYPPQDLLFDIVDIAVYCAPNSSVTLELIVEGSQWRSDCVFLKVICNAGGDGAVSSMDINGPLVAEFRVFVDPDVNSCSEPVHTGRHFNGWVKYLNQSVAVDPLIDRAVAVAREWLHGCEKQHGERCKPPYMPTNPSWENMPTRVLYIPPEGTTIYLKVPREAKLDDGRYVALSHCWGVPDDAPPFTTTTLNLQERMDGISLRELPATFLDAVKIVRALGLRYLWIDSLCIIQDNGEWVTESAKMGNVYRDAHLVLAAARGVSDGAGFLGPRKMLDVVYLPPQQTAALGLQLLPPDGTFQGSTNGRRWTSNGGLGPDPVNDEPLTDRAWCLQERYLATRCLQYCSRQMIWECQLARASENGDILLQEGSYFQTLCAGAVEKSTVFQRDKDQRRPDWEDASIRWADWYRMVEGYTARHITYDKDRLPAVAGLATAVGTATGQRDYMAGLWETGLLEGLMWSRKDPDRSLTLPDTWTAPSWSWASVKGAVHFPVYNWYNTRAAWKARMANYEPLAVYCDYTFETMRKDSKDSKDRFGQLTKASLSIEAPLLPVISMQPRPAETPGAFRLLDNLTARSPVADHMVQLQLDPVSQVWVDCGFDTGAEVDQHGLFVVLLARLPHLVDQSCLDQRFGLLVRKLGDSTYQRVGFVDGCLLQTNREAISRWIEMQPTYWKHNNADLSKKKLDALISKMVKQLRKQLEENEKSGAAMQLEYREQHRLAQSQYDLDEAEPPNILAPDPFILPRTRVVLV
ncbi:HET-domain-containing protein [Thozetella sp. PMI_491]|nr:HET-domain-containing protein [Thozetella sp. PMI_491]